MNLWGAGMSITALTGSRLRERRLQLGLRQAEVAEAAGMSPSYLNLIEHNRRKIGLGVLERLAAALEVSVEALAGDGGAELVEELRAAAAEHGAGLPVELAAVEDLVGRFPGWAGLVAAQARKAGRLTQAVEALNDRLSHDPHLSAAIHEVLSAVSSVRSVAGILAETEDIEPEWRQRFHRSLHEDSERLAVGAEALVAYLDGSEQAADEVSASAQEEVEAWLAARDWQPGNEGIAELASGAARDLARAFAAQAAADAALLPEGPFREAMARIGPDPVLLAAAFGCDVPPAFRRIALLPGSGAGLVVCDASGTFTFRKPVEGFSIPRFGAACALWPLYAALGSAMRPVSAEVMVAGRAGRRFSVRAFCQPRWPQGFAGPELREALMLILPPPAPVAGAAVLQVGSTCRICPAQACPARREATIVTDG